MCAVAATTPQVLALSGGVGGAKLALGLSKIVPADRLTVIANTGDDFEHLGLTICPDIDTLTYTLSGLNNQDLGWGRAGETWTFMEVLGALGGETWFNLGDGDLALHVERTRRLKAGESLSEVTADITGRLGIAVPVLPMSDDPVRTIVHTPGGELAFQHYFVRDRCEPAVTGFSFQGIYRAQAQPRMLEILADTALEAVVITPSNPFVSIDPILQLPGVTEAFKACKAPVVAVSPIVGGQAIKGPAAKMMAELGMPASALEVARHYAGLIDGFVLDDIDAMQREEIDKLGLAVHVTNTVMHSLEDRVALARNVIAFANGLRKLR